MAKVEVREFTPAEMRHHRSEKWRDAPADVLPLPVAEMDFEIAEPIRNLLIEMVQRSDLGYLGPIPELGISFAQFAKNRWQWTLDPEQIHTVTDVGVGVVEVLRLFTKPGDKVLISSPVYHNFYTWVNETGVEKVDVPFLQNGNGWEIDFEGIKQAYKSGIKVHILCSPHNPIGRVYLKDELLQIAQLALEYGVVVISDEIHAPLTFAESTFIPFLSLGAVAEEVGVTITAASKAWNIAGLKCAIVVTQNDAMSKRISALPPATHYRASLLGAFATATAFADCEPWLDAVLEKLDSNRRFLKKILHEKLPTVRYEIPECSYLAWLDLASLNLGENPTKVLLEKGKVSFNPGHTFGPHTGQFTRLNFATSQNVLTQAVDRMVHAL